MVVNSIPDKAPPHMEDKSSPHMDYLPNLYTGMHLKRKALIRILEALWSGEVECVK